MADVKQVHHPDCGIVGDVGDVGDLGTNAIDHPVRIAQDKGQPAPAVPSVAPAPPTPGGAADPIVKALMGEGYSQAEAEAMAKGAREQLAARKGA